MAGTVNGDSGAAGRVTVGGGAAVGASGQAGQRAAAAVAVTPAHAPHRVAAGAGVAPAAAGRRLAALARVLAGALAVMLLAAVPGSAAAALRPTGGVAAPVAGAGAAGSSAAVAADQAVAEPLTIEAFVREGCPHCAEAERFLAVLGAEQPALRIVVRDVSRDPAALARLRELAAATGTGAARVPAVHVGGQLIVGYSAPAHTDRLIRAALAGAQVAAAAHAAHETGTCAAAEDEAAACGPPTGAQAAAPAPAAEAFAIDLFGRTLTLDDVGLPAFTLAMGLLDGFNPCSMWVLLLMISLLAPLNDRRRMVAIAGTFVAIEGIAYFLFMTAWLNLFLFIGVSRASQLIVAAIAIVAGLLNLKDGFVPGRGPSLSIPASARPGIYQRMRGLVNARSIPAAIAGAAVLAVLIQIVEFMCTSGFPALFTRILTLRGLEPAAYYGYMLLYIAAYMLDDIVVLTIGVVMLSRHRLQEKEGRVLKLVSGLVMIGLGIYLVLDGSAPG